MSDPQHGVVGAVASDEHFRRMARYIRGGVLIPFLGAGVHLSHAETLSFERAERPPSGGELAELLAERSGYPAQENQSDLLRVSQYMSVTEGDGALYRELRKVFKVEYPPTATHRFLASLPAIVRTENDVAATDDARVQYPLIVTTNYDDALERAFSEAGEQIDVLTYVAQGEDVGRLHHRDPAGDERPVRHPNKYGRASLRERAVVLKIHGAVNRTDAHGDSYVITEDHYIDYLTRTEIKKLVPAIIAEDMYMSHFLFLGYSLRDWNLRVILHRIWGDRDLDYQSWAVQHEPSEVDAEFWKKRGVDIIDADVDSYVDRLRQALAEPRRPRDD